MSTVELVVATVEFLAPAASFKRRFIPVIGRIIALKVDFRLPTVELIVVTVEFPHRWPASNEVIVDLSRLTVELSP
ncbi:hypothetical protein ACQKL6_14330 [Peribacillus sp. NPDC097197]|uniref:hypothetical protein n=1 Tax=unclassified Peribacillus TaxID=2675266 RepID=UPI0038270B84